MPDAKSQPWVPQVRSDLTPLFDVQTRGVGAEIQAKSWADALFRDALNKGVSDIYISCQREVVQVRVRIDGTVFDAVQSTHEQGTRLIRHFRAEDYHLVLEHGDERMLRECLAQRNHRPLLADGLTMVTKGITSLDELRMLGSLYVPPTQSASARLLNEIAVKGSASG